MMMDGTPALLVLMPIRTPIATAHGINPIHFGILVEANVALELATPPVGAAPWSDELMPDISLRPVALGPREETASSDLRP
jgi:TRAP-type mannitol/chloroaromatic compound transport system permease large subunit